MKKYYSTLLLFAVTFLIYVSSCEKWKRPDPPTPTKDYYILGWANDSAWVLWETNDSLIHFINDSTIHFTIFTDMYPHQNAYVVWGFDNVADEEKIEGMFMKSYITGPHYYKYSVAQCERVNVLLNLDDIGSFRTDEYIEANKDSEFYVDHVSYIPGTLPKEYNIKGRFNCTLVDEFFGGTQRMIIEEGRFSFRLRACDR